MSRSTVLVLFALSAALGAACAGSKAGPTRCPGSGWCGPAAEAEKMAEPAAGSTLTCPIHVEAAYAARQGEGEGAQAGELPAGVPAGAHGTLDEKRTRQLRSDGDMDTCCYAWVEPCPAGG
ncbi:MAG TPA: hypothetical protein VIK91_28460 [Nannocystis sp.]